MAWHHIGHKPLSEAMMSQITKAYINVWVQDCSISSVLALEILKSCTKPSYKAHLAMMFWKKKIVSDIVIQIPS